MPSHRPGCADTEAPMVRIGAGVFPTPSLRSPWLKALYLFCLGCIFLATGSLFLGGGSSSALRLTPDGSILLAQQSKKLSLTIITAPFPYTDSGSDPQRRALLSWLRLKPAPRVVLLGNHPSFFQLAKDYPAHVTVEPGIDCNFRGIPLVHSMLARAQAVDTDLTAIVAPDVILLNTIYRAARRAHAHFESFLLVAASWKLAELPYVFDSKGISAITNGALASPSQSSNGPSPQGKLLDQDVMAHVRSNGRLRTWEVDLFLWNQPGQPLLNSTVPPFAYGRGQSEHWLTHEIIHRGFRDVVDASDVAGGIIVKFAAGDWSKGANGSAVVGATQAQALRWKVWNTPKHEGWEVFANAHMAQSHGSYVARLGTVGHAPYRLAACLDYAEEGVCLLERVRPGSCSCEHSPYAKETQSDPKVEGNHMSCGPVQKEKPTEPPEPLPTVPSGASKFVHSVEDLLPLVADENKTVVLVAVSHQYIDMLMSFVCRLRQLGLPNPLVAAMDEAMYRFAYEQGLPVYYELAAADKELKADYCGWGSDCFSKVTKGKTRAVIRVLKLGYNVFFTDVDIVYFRDPFPEIFAYGPGVLAIQSNEYNVTKAPNSVHGINSGLYFARSEPTTIKAFTEIVDKAAHGGWTEQSFFNTVLCGPDSSSSQRRGDNECYYEDLRVALLDRDMHPNGAYRNIWDEKNATEACKKIGCATLHNNFIAGHENKKDRLMKHGFWHYNNDTRLCQHDYSQRFASLPSPF